MKEVLIQNYNNLNQLNLPFKEAVNEFLVNFVGGAKIEILGDKQAEYNIKFINNKNGNIIFETSISNNMWTKPNISYFIE